MYFPLPNEIEISIKKLNESGFEAFLVGGAVRDYLLGKKPHDFDLCTSALPEQTMAVFKNYRTIATGLKYGTVTVLIKERPIEITTFRTDLEYLDGRHPEEVCFTPDLKEDLRRRDFTINAMSYHPEQGLIDFFHGQEDLAARLLRCVGEPEQRFQEDALRLFRALRFASTMQLKIEEKTSKAILKFYPTLTQIAKERIQVELKKLLIGKNVSDILLMYRDVFAFIIPELRATFDFEQHSPYHIYPVYRHIVEVVKNIPAEPTLRLAALFHDINKPQSFTLGENGIGHFYQHANYSALTAKQILQDLRFDKKTIDTVYTLIKYHDAPLQADRSFLKKRARKLGFPILYSLIDLQKADTLGLAPKLHEERLNRLNTVKEMVKSLEAEKVPLAVTDLAVNGYDAMQYGLRNKQIGQALQLLLEKVSDHNLKNERQSLLFALEEIAATLLNSK